jgi:hypothetical protein
MCIHFQLWGDCSRADCGDFAERQKNILQNFNSNDLPHILNFLTRSSTAFCYINANTIICSFNNFILLLLRIRIELGGQQRINNLLSGQLATD